MIAPSAAFGRSAIGPVRNSSTSTTAAAASRPAIWLRAPIASLTAVREPLAPSGRPWVTPAAACAAPMASSSWSTRMCWSCLPANERAVRTASAKQTRKMPIAAGSSVSVSPSGGEGTCSSGQTGGDRADDRDAVGGEVERGRSRDRADDDEQRRRHLRREEAQAQQDRQGDRADRPRWRHGGRRDRGRPPRAAGAGPRPSTSSPSSFSSWPMTSTIATPWMYPISTGLER